MHDHQLDATHCIFLGFAESNAIGMTLHTAIARSTGNKAKTHLDDATELIVHELSFLLPLRSPDDPGADIKRYDIMHINPEGLMVRWGCCTPSELLHQLDRFGIPGTEIRVWMPV